MMLFTFLQCNLPICSGGMGVTMILSCSKWFTKLKIYKALKVPLFMYCLTPPRWSAEMVGVEVSSLKGGTVDNFKAPWEASVWQLVILANWEELSWALFFSFFNIFTKTPVGNKLRTPHVFTIRK